MLLKFNFDFILCSLPLKLLKINYYVVSENIEKILKPVLIRECIIHDPKWNFKS